MKLTKENRKKIQNKLKKYSQIGLGVCLGAASVGLLAALELNSRERKISGLIIDNELLSMGLDVFCTKSQSLKHEIDIRDCMIMEGIDGDPDIYSRRMQHFRDYEIQTKDLGQDLEYSKYYCDEAALDAEVVYSEYLRSLKDKSFESEVPDLPNDEEMPF